MLLGIANIKLGQESAPRFDADPGSELLLPLGIGVQRALPGSRLERHGSGQTTSEEQDRYRARWRNWWGYDRRRSCLTIGCCLVRTRMLAPDAEGVEPEAPMRRVRPWASNSLPRGAERELKQVPHPMTGGQPIIAGFRISSHHCR